MKRFFVFCIIIIVSVSIGYMSYFFLQDNEAIVMEETFFQLNAGESRQLELERIKPKSSTEITYTVDDPNIVELNQETKQITALTGGVATITISCTNENINDIIVEVNVGNGTEQYPYYIRSQADLRLIGVTDAGNEFGSDDCYRLVNDITLSDAWVPIANFSGVFYGDFHTIYNLNITGTKNNAGLFASVDQSGIVQYLNFENVNIEGQFDNVGVVAGVNYGDIRTCYAKGKVINTNATLTSTTGGLIGLNAAYGEAYAEAHLSKSTAYMTVKGSGKVGGLIGANQGGYLYNSYIMSGSTVEGTLAESRVGGLVGSNESIYSKASVIKDCYSLASLTVVGADTAGHVLGYNQFDSEVEESSRILNLIVGSYYLIIEESTLSGVGGYIDVDPSATANDLFAKGIMGIKGKTLGELKDKNTFASHINRRKGTELLVWDFNDAWMIPENSTPVINVDGANVGIALSTINIGGNTLNSSGQLTSETFNLAGKFTIVDDIDMGGAVITPIGSIDDGFRGVLVGEWIEEKQRYPKIFNYVLASGENVGLFACIESKGEITNLSFEQVSTLDNENNAITVNTFGALAGINNGSLTNVTYQGDNTVKVKGTGNASEVYVGGLVGINNGSLNDCHGVVGVLNMTSMNGVSSYLGGLVGKNSKSISLSDVSGGDIILDAGYNGGVGGIAGINVNRANMTGGTDVATISSCFNAGAFVKAGQNYAVSASSIHQFDAHFAGGIVGTLKSGSVTRSFASNMVEGFVVGGVAGLCTDYIAECSFEGEVLGHRAGGLVGYQLGSSTIENNNVTGVIKSTDVSFNVGDNYSATSFKAGLVAITERRNDVRPKVRHNFINCTFGATTGSNYGVTASPRSLTNKTGIVTANIVNKGRTGGLSSNDGAVTGLIKDWFTDEQTYEISDNEAQGNASGGYKTFIDLKFSESIWEFGLSGYPTLKNVVKNPAVDGSGDLEL